MPKLSRVRAAEHGRNIFVYCNIRTNQVIYSLTRALKVGILCPLPLLSRWFEERFQEKIQDYWLTLYYLRRLLL
jgi:hypothetical protein